MLTLEKACANRTPIDWDSYPSRCRRKGREYEICDYDSGRAARVHRLAAVLQRLGDEGMLPDILNNPASAMSCPQAVRRRPADA